VVTEAVRDPIVFSEVHSPSDSICALVTDTAHTRDWVGNRKTATRGSLVANASTRYYNYTAGTNRLAEVRIGSVSGTLESGFTNDFEGRLTAQTGTGAKTLTWDAKGRVKTVGSEAYTYDPMDYRIGRSGGSLGNRSFFLEGEHLESEYSGSQLQARYFRGSTIDELVAAWLLDSDGKTRPYLFHQDQVTSTTAISGHNGGTVQSAKYAAFGQVQAGTGSSVNRQRYTGREDDGTGLMYYRARYFDSSIGRFISEDPLGYAAGVNFYAYVNNNPINANDPMGLEPYKPFPTLGAALVSAGRWNAAQTAGIQRPTGLPIEFASRVFLLGENYYYTPSVAAFYRGTDGNPIVNPSLVDGLIPSGARIVGESHSHPSGYSSNPSTADQSRARQLGTLPSSLGNSDGSVTRYDGSAMFRNGRILPGESQIAPPLSGGIVPFNFRDASEPDFLMPTGSSTSGAAGGYLIYPNKPNNNSAIGVYRK